MNKLITASIIAISLASPALAESPAAWPREPIAGNYGTARAVRTAPAATVNAWTDDFATFSDWKALPAGADAGGQHATPVAELDAQQRQYRAYWMARHQELTANGQWADVLPVRIHERLNAKAFGSPVMGGAQ